MATHKILIELVETTLRARGYVPLERAYSPDDLDNIVRAANCENLTSKVAIIAALAEALKRWEAPRRESFNARV